MQEELIIIIIIIWIYILHSREANKATLFNLPIFSYLHAYPKYISGQNQFKTNTTPNL